MFNPEPRIETVVLDNGARCYVIDDVLKDPGDLVRMASENRLRFKDVDYSSYPGISMPVPPALFTASRDFFNFRMRPFVDARRLMAALCRFAMVLSPPERLLPFQMFCHQDTPLLDSAYSVTGSVIYLFRDSSLGGTGFYEPVRPRPEISELFSDSIRLSKEVFLEKYAIAPGYMSGSNAYFKRVGAVAAKWNRMVFYDGRILHSGDILNPGRLTPDPLSGRLTVNGFFSCRRNLA